MKKGISNALATLVLVVFAAPYAQGESARDLDLKLFGSSFTTSSQDDGTPTLPGLAGTSMQSGIAKGSGRAVFSAQTVIDAALPDARCPAELPVGGNLTVIGVYTYNDGSILSLATGTDSFYCSDGFVFAAELAGIVTGGDRRFEGATGTWEGNALVDGSRLTGNIGVDLD